MPNPKIQLQTESNYNAHCMHSYTEQGCSLTNYAIFGKTARLQVQFKSQGRMLQYTAKTETPSINSTRHSSLNRDIASNKVLSIQSTT